MYVSTTRVEFLRVDLHILGGDFPAHGRSALRPRSPGQPITGGRTVSAAAIKNLYERVWNQFTPHVELTSHVIERSGDLAYDSGEYVETVVSGRSAVNIAGNYVFVCRREPSGWRIVEQIWTEASGAPEADPRAR